MAVRTQEVHIPLNRGQNQQTQKFALPPPELETATNVEFEELGGLAKRSGSANLSLTDSTARSARPLGVFEHDGEPVVVDKGSASVFPSVLGGETLQVREIDTDIGDRQYYNPCSVEITDPTGRPGNQTTADQATATNGYTLRAWEEIGSAVTYYALTDDDGVLLASGLGTATGTNPKVRACGNYLHLYTWNSGLQRVRVTVIDATDVGSGFSTPATVLNGAGNAEPFYAVHAESTGTWVAVVDTGATGDYSVQIIADDGTLGATVIAVRPVGPSGMIDLTYSSYLGGVIAVARCELGFGGATVDVRLDWLDSTTLADEADVNIQMNATACNQNLTVAATDSGDAYVIFDVTDTPSSGPVSQDYFNISVREHTLGDGASLGTTYDDYFGYRLASRACHTLVDGRNAILFHASYAGIDTAGGGGGSPPDPVYSTNRHYLLIDAITPNGEDPDTTPATHGVIAYTLPGTAFAYTDQAFVLTSGDFDNQHLLPDLQDLGSLQYSWAALFERDTIKQAGVGSPTYTQISFWGIKQIKYTLNDTRAIRGQESNGVTYLPGGFLAQYDGMNICEHGFFAYPDQVVQEATMDTASGSLPENSTFTYRFYWEWRNAKGQLERSTTGKSYEVNIGGTGTNTNAPQFYIPTVGATLRRRTDITLAVFRTNEDDNVFFRCSSTDPAKTSYVTASSSVHYVTWQDDEAADLTGNELDLTFNSSALDGVPALTPQVLSSGQYRLFYVGPEDDSRIRFSLTSDLQETPKFNEALVLAVPERGGAIKAIEAAEDALWIFKERAVYVSTGTGPDNLGNGAYGQPQIISQDVGCTEPGSVVRTPRGVLFKSEKGFYVADRGYNLTYVGYPTFDQLSEEVLSAVSQPDKHRVLFFTASSVFCYNYMVDAWADWSIEGETAVLCGTDVYFTDGQTFKKLDSSVYTDSGSNYRMIVETAWIPLNGIAGFGRIRRWAVLGEYLSEFTLFTQVAYDRQATYVDSTEIDYTGANAQTAGDRIHPRQRCSIQKTTAVKFYLADDTTDTGASVVFNGLTLEIGVKGGVVKTGESTVTVNGGPGAE